MPGSVEAPPEAVMESLTLLGAQPWAAYETCYGVLNKLLENVVKNPDEPKFRSIRKANAAIKAKVLDCPGGAELLLAAGFLDELESYTLPVEVSVDSVQVVLNALRPHAVERQHNQIRAVRDEKIAKEKAEEAKLAEMGGFARGRHKLGGGSAAASDVVAGSAAASDVVAGPSDAGGAA
eukprot:TRINITY_DN6145_c0_g1_i1.p1 TRINITY_DN6145_c0_g1~~TRINITY_DN6145_c0_g1_i1.p1  ORF type:complete len:207 (-),score=47.36 TRINITY_DN6145_c0_g1_i1:71-607(-)